MKINGMSYEVSRRVNFSAMRFRSDHAPRAAFDFAWDMTFGNQGQHRNHRTGGVARRGNGEIFANTLQGKLAEFAVCQELERFGISVTPDLSRDSLGKWDSFDIRVNGIEIAIKSTKRYGNLLLLETQDWTVEGDYLHHRESKGIDFLCLVRVDPSPEDLMRRARILFNRTCNRALLESVAGPEIEFTFQVVGQVSRSDLGMAVQERHVIPRGAMLNGHTRMDATNYYIQACDFKPIESLRQLL